MRDGTGSLGVLDWIKNTAKEIAEGIRDTFGNLINLPAPKVVVFPGRKEVEIAQARVEGYERLKEKPELCPLCNVVAVGIHPDGHFKKLCKQCGAVDGKMPVKPLEGNICPAEGCGVKMNWSGGVLRCQNHGQPEQPMGDLRPLAVNGVSRKQYVAQRSLDNKFGSWGRFGRRG